MVTEPSASAPPASLTTPPPWRIDGIDAAIQGLAVRAAAEANLPLSDWLARAIEQTAARRPPTRVWPLLLAGLTLGFVAAGGILLIAAWSGPAAPPVAAVDPAPPRVETARADPPRVEPTPAPAPAAAPEPPPPAAAQAAVPSPAPAPETSAPPAAAEDDPLAELRAAAEDGDSDARFALAARYAEGDGVTQDWPSAFKWFLLSARDGVPAAQHNVAYLYERGLGTAPDPAEAFAWYREAAGSGYPPSQYSLAVAYARGVGVPPDIEAAIHWFERAATTMPAAHYSLGQIYETGFRVPRDLARARTHYRAAADAGEERARERLASLAPPPNPRDVLREIQALLARLRYDPGPADGAMGTRTRNAIRAFQAHAGQPVDGEPSVELLEALRAVAGG